MSLGPTAVRCAILPAATLAALLSACGGGGSTQQTTSTTGTGGAGTGGATGTTTETGSTTGSTSTTSTSTGTGGAPPAGFVFGPYKDVGINLDWNTNVLSTQVLGAQATLLSVLPLGLDTVTWAFATGECGAETWAGLTPKALVDANVPGFQGAGKRYIISTGGAAGSFTCGTDAGFAAFLATYDSPAFAGVDFDIEAGQTKAQIDDLVQRVVTARKTRPGLRVSFTLATLAPGKSGSTQAVSLGAAAPDPLGTAGQTVMASIKAHGLTDYLVNLMVMDYGSANPTVCVVGADGRCDMGQSAIQAAMDLHDHHGLPYAQIELTPMIGGNDVTDEVFTLADADAVAAFAKAQGLSGVHFWSLDRDNDCTQTWASATCNSYGQAGALGFTKRFLSAL